jgi:hypothetical protein
MILDSASTQWSLGGTLVFVAFTSEGISLACDGFSRHGDGTPWVGVQKIFQVEKFGALAFIGDLRVQAREGSALVDQVDVLALTNEWLSGHPDVDINSARDALRETIKVAFTEFYAKYDPGPSPNRCRFRMVLTGYSDGKPVISRSKFYQPAVRRQPMVVECLYSEPEPGQHFSFGKYLVCDEVLFGTSCALSEFKAEPVIAYFRELVGRKEHRKLRLDEYLRISEVCLRATESEEGREFDRDPAEVGAPNRFARITPTDGFAWQKRLPPFKKPD